MTFHKQQGATLVVAMIMLLVMTILGVTAMQKTTLEERMAGNMRDSNLAFQAAEAALRAGEGWLGNIANRFAVEGTLPIGPQIIWNGTAPAATGGVAMGVNSGLLADPVFFISQSAVIVETDPARRPLGLDQDPCKRVFPVTSFGQGSTNTAITVLRSGFEAGGFVPCPGGI